ncbi:hypothetical protein ACXJJ3_41995 (plasmid) [Kribbella sp. WER1]
MMTYRVPVDLAAPPAPPQFVDVKDFWDKMIDALGIYARRSVTITAAGGATVRRVTELRHNFYVVLPAPGAPPSTGAAPADEATAAVDRAMRQIGLTEQQAVVDVAAVEELTDPAGD